MKAAIKDLENSLLAINHVASEEILKSIGKEIPPIELIEDLLVPVMKRIGDGWENGTVALSQVYMSGRFMEKWVDTILLSGNQGRMNQIKMGIAVLEDYHMLGKRIVYSLLRASGFDLQDYGHVNVQKAIRKIQDDKVEVLLISTLMLHSALRVEALKEEIVRLGLPVKIIVGGAPFRFDTELWKEVGADAMAYNANDSIQLIDKILEDKK